MAVHERAPAEGLSAGGAESAERERALADLEARISVCRACPRLVEWRERVAREKRAKFAGEEYWGRPVPGFGDPAARVYVIGLAPAAHGGNRTGRVFTGDRAADFLWESLHRLGYANQGTSRHVGDGLRTTDLWVGAAVRCAPPQNRPTTEERDRCLPFAREELALLSGVQVIVCLGKFAWDATARMLGVRPLPRFGHGAEHQPETGPLMLGCFHPSQQNTFTGKLTPPMIDAVFARARELTDG